MKSLLKNFTAICLFASLTGCATMSATSCRSGEQFVVQEQLYFGTDKPSGRVSAEEWTQFLGEVAAPRFPDGFTTWGASGQWRGASGALIQEPSWVLSLVHLENAIIEKAVREILSTYKRVFNKKRCCASRRTHACRANAEAA
jgi:Protein of unknown function (DUF3574)